MLDVWTPACGTRVHARVRRPAGRPGTPLVTVHGLGVSAASLGPLAERLAEDRLVLGVDLPGFGATDARDVWTTARHAEALLRLLERRGLRRVVLAGHSYGCLVAAMAARDAPERVAALVLLSPSFDRRRRSPVAQALLLALDAPLERPALLAGALRDYLRAGPRRVLATLVEASRIPLEDVIAEVPAPVLVVRGSRDPLTPARWAAELARAAPRGWVAQVPGAAHALGYDAPAATAAAVRAFLAGAGAEHRARMARRPRA